MKRRISSILALTDFTTVSAARRKELMVLVDFIVNKRAQNAPIQLNFICTHNSRRSQFAQVWAAVAAHYHKIEISTFSGGVEVTECNLRTVESLGRFGFDIAFEHKNNPEYTITFDAKHPALTLYSKLFDHAENPSENFAAIMTCSHADENCPLVLGSDQRIPLTYDDPKYYDDSPLENAMYDNRSFQIATEMMFVFNQVAANGERK